MQAVMAREEFIDGPGTEASLLRLMHLEVDLVPGPVVERHDCHEHRARTVQRRRSRQLESLLSALSGLSAGSPGLHQAGQGRR